MESKIKLSEDGKTLLRAAQDITDAEVIIPDTVTTIGEQAFFNCLNLTNITMPESVTNLKDGAFSCCFNLHTINFFEQKSGCVE